MLRLIKLYADNDAIREIAFKSGLNLIRGDNSKDEEGNITSRRQNGVGKSFSVELIDFCLMRGIGESKFPLIKDKYFGRETFVYLHFQSNGVDYVVGRNKKGETKIKGRNGTFKDYGYEDAKKYLDVILGFDSKPIGVRDYMNFFIKHEDYSYKKFNLLYKGTYTELLKIHFYLFDISLETLKKISKAFDERERAQALKRSANKWLEENDLDIDKLKAKRNELEQRVLDLEEDFNYDKLLMGYEAKAAEVRDLERKLEVLISDKSLLESELRDIEDYINDVDDDIYIDDQDVKLVFEKYRKGLGELVQSDLESLYEFRDQLSQFKEDLVVNKRSQLLESISSLQDKIDTHKQKVDKFYAEISDSKKNAIVKSFRVYKDDLYDSKQYDQYIDQYDSAVAALNDASAKFALATDELHRVVTNLNAQKKEFVKTFLAIHKRVTHSDSASFDFTVNVASKVSDKTDFFKFNVIVETAGSRGANQMRAAIYDASIHSSEVTKGRTLGFLLHDNLVFGSMDVESSINYLNLMSEFVAEEMQYIATVNNDQFDYQELRERFTFDIDDNVIINLTRQEPLFKRTESDFIDE